MDWPTTFNDNASNGTILSDEEFDNHYFLKLFFLTG